MNKVFSLKTKNNNSKNKKVESFYEKAMEELKDFYMINWIENTPVVFLVDTRKDFDLLVNEKSENWIVGQNLGNDRLLLLSPEGYEKESIHRYCDEEYFFLIKHELSHLFYNIFSNEKGPNWLNEGFAIFTSGQLKKKKRIKKFKNFLKYYDHFDKGIYEESGFVVEFLIKKFGKERVLEFLKKLKSVNNEKEFKESFEKEFGFELGYEGFNEGRRF